MLKGLLKRVREDDGFTLIELMVVVLIIGILVAIALPTFLGARERAQNRAAQSNLRNGVAAAKTHFTDGETYTGFTVALAQSIEPSLTWAVAATTTVDTVAIAVEGAAGETITLQTESASGNGYCVTDTATGPGTRYGSNTDGGNFADAAACAAGPDW